MDHGDVPATRRTLASSALAASGRAQRAGVCGPTAAAPRLCGLVMACSRWIVVESGAGFTRRTARSVASVTGAQLQPATPPRDPVLRVTFDGPGDSYTRREVVVNFATR